MVPPCANPLPVGSLGARARWGVARHASEVRATSQSIWALNCDEMCSSLFRTTEQLCAPTAGTHDCATARKRSWAVRVSESHSSRAEGAVQTLKMDLRAWCEERCEWLMVISSRDRGRLREIAEVTRGSVSLRNCKLQLTDILSGPNIAPNGPGGHPQRPAACSASKSVWADSVPESGMPHEAPRGNGGPGRPRDPQGVYPGSPGI